jgi:serine/threonine protein kinase
MSAEAGNPDWKKIKEIFHEALRREPPDRELFLNESCDGDLGLRLEVESLLFSLDHARTFLEEPAFISTPGQNVVWQFRSGEIVSHYRIVEPIGAGGMGQVYLAEDQKLHRQVALKILPIEVLEDIDRLRRFKREALAISALNHPNILTIFEFDDVDGVPSLASEYVRGNTLRERLEAAPLEVDVAVDIAVQVASALQTAHEAGVIHRDIKPENIMIRDDGYVKVLDFGLAKLTGDMRSRETERTQTQAFSLPGVIMGTTAYMSPEQARSKSIDSRTDIFSFGIVLYEMLSGRPPFSGETATDVIAEIIQKDPPNVSTQNSAVRAELDQIVIKCLQKDRADRYQTAADLLVDLRSLSKPGVARTITDDGETKPHETSDSEKPMIEAGDRSTSDERVMRFGLAFAVAALTLLLGIAAAAYWYFVRVDR